MAKRKICQFLKSKFIVFGFVIFCSFLNFKLIYAMESKSISDELATISNQLKTFNVKTQRLNVRPIANGLEREVLAKILTNLPQDQFKNFYPYKSMENDKSMENGQNKNNWKEQLKFVENDSKNFKYAVCLNDEVNSVNSEPKIIGMVTINYFDNFSEVFGKYINLSDILGSASYFSTLLNNVANSALSSLSNMMKINVVNLGICIDKECQNKGYGTEVFLAVVKQLLNSTNLNAVSFAACQSNTVACKLVKEILKSTDINSLGPITLNLSDYVDEMQWSLFYKKSFLNFS